MPTQVSSAGRIGLKKGTAEGQELWLKAEEPFSHYFYHPATITRRATRTRLATPQVELTIPLEQVNVPVLNTKSRIQSRLDPAILKKKRMQV
ncbi:hypothetical protein TcYC6_0102860 [Trypanosoma cruzi]|nr:hypothetical protein TcYC6_0102860 [Trypanosoma cruzi]